MNDRQIKKINNKIKKVNNKIRYLEIRENILLIMPGAILISGVTIYTFINSDDIILTSLYPFSFLGSILIGMVPICIRDDNKLKVKINKCNIIIQNNVNQLHEQALKENEKIKKKVL